jgi:hypothetical protein
MIHPEKQPNEIYLGNWHPKDVHYCTWNSKRLGNIPYDRDNDPIIETDLKPIFILKSEVQNKINLEKDLNTIKLFEEMIKEEKVL